MEIRNIKLEELESNNKDGIVILGINSSAMDSIDMLANVFQEKQITQTSDPEEIFTDAILVDRNDVNDLILIFNKDCEIDLDKMIEWKTKFGDCSWLNLYLNDFKEEFEED